MAWVKVGLVLVSFLVTTMAGINHWIKEISEGLV